MSASQQFAANFKRVKHEVVNWENANRGNDEQELVLVENQFIGFYGQDFKCSFND